jgi:RHS repeat-associated protein
MNPNRSTSNLQNAVYQYTYNAKKASGVCLQNVTDYSPFGAALDGRTIEGDFYRRAFNGMEKDDELKGKGNSYTTEFRQYDPRLGKWLTIDPETRSFPWSSPYVSMSNNPISRIDPLGNSDGHYVDEDGNYLGEDGNTSDKNVYVIKKNDYNAIGNKLSTEGTKTLQDKSTPLESYTKGINISRATWDKMNNSKTDVKWLTPSVNNNSDYTVYFKPEGTYGDVQNDGAYPIKPHTDLYAPVDGVSSKEIKKSAVYKVPDGNQVIVNNQGMNTDVIATDDGIGVIVSFFADLIKGGWSTDAPDASWKNLEKKSE